MQRSWPWWAELARRPLTVAKPIVEVTDLRHCHAIATVDILVANITAFVDSLCIRKGCPCKKTGIVKKDRTGAST